MKLFIFLFLMTTQAWSESCDHLPNQFSCVKYVRNSDGETITFTLPGIHPFFGNRAKVKLLGVDAPKFKFQGVGRPCEAAWAKVAKRQVEAELKNAQRIDIIKLSGMDDEGRILGQVMYDGKNLNEVLLKFLLVVLDNKKQKTKVNWCEKQSLREKYHGPKKL